jgi:hypothetical protein
MAWDANLIIRTTAPDKAAWRWELVTDNSELVARGLADSEVEARERAQKVARIAELNMRSCKRAE